MNIGLELSFPEALMRVRREPTSIRVAWMPASVAGVLLAACGTAPRPPLATTVCDLPAHAQRTVQLTANVSVDAAGTALISDTACAATQIELRLSAAGSRSGGAERLQSAAKAAVGGGQGSFSVRLTGVYTSTAGGATFVADSVAPPS